MIQGGFIGFQGVVHQSQFPGQPDPCVREVGPDHPRNPQGAAQHGGGQANRPQAGDQYSVGPADLHPAERLVSGAEAAGAERPVDIGKRIGQEDAGVFLGQHIFRMAAVALPAVGGPEVAPAADHIAVLAFVTDAAAGDVVDHHPVARLESLAARPDLFDPAARLVACDHALVALRAFSQVLPVNGPDIAPADGGCLHPHQYLAPSRLRNRILPEFHRAASGQHHSGHRSGRHICRLL